MNLARSDLAAVELSELNAVGENVAKRNWKFWRLLIALAGAAAFGTAFGAELTWQTSR